MCCDVYVCVCCDVYVCCVVMCVCDVCVYSTVGGDDRIKAF